MSRISTRRSDDTDVSIRWIVSIACVRSVSVYVKMAATMTSKIGQQASATPSSVASIACGSVMPSKEMPTAQAMASAIEQAFQADMRSTVSATMSQRIGDRARKNKKTSSLN